MRYKRKMQMNETTLIANLILWSNDPDFVEEVRPHAEAGNPHAQYAMGLIYAEGRGVEQDNQEAYIWLSQAGEQGDRDAELLRAIVMQNMDADDIQCAERMLSSPRR